MARQALTIIGAVVGAYFGQPQLGAMVGPAIGELEDPPQYLHLINFEVGHEPDPRST